MELPPYRMPTFKALSIYTWQRGWMYLKKAGTIILLASVILWFAKTYPKPTPQSLHGLNAQQTHELELSTSVIGRIGKTIEPALRPLGFDWKIGTALVGSVAAKELFITQMAIVYAVEADAEQSHNLRYQLQETYTENRGLIGFCIMLFCLISSPCVATVAMTKQETGKWSWAMFQFFGLTVLAYIVTLIVYQSGILLAGLW
jgi:ferrous iron transport protein B